MVIRRVFVCWYCLCAVFLMLVGCPSPRKEPSSTRPAPAARRVLVPRVAPLPVRRLPSTIRRTYTVRRGDTLIGILQNHLSIQKPLLKFQLRDEIAEFVDLRAIRPGHTMWADFQREPRRLLKLVYQKSPVHEWNVAVCWKGQPCYANQDTKGDRDAARVSWTLETTKVAVNKRLVRVPLQIQIGGNVRTFTQGFRSLGHSPSLAARLASAFGGQVSLSRVFGGERLDVLAERVRYKGRLYGVKRVLLARFRNRSGRLASVVHFSPPAAARLSEGSFRVDGSRSLKEQLFSYPVRPFRLSSRYGWRRHPIYKRRRMHWGIDTRSGCGTRIYAAAAGRVITRGYRGGAGRMISIRHADGWVSRYFHLSRYAVRRYSRVQKGQLIGYVGSTGASTGCHLHFELMRYGRHINPLRVLRLQRTKRLACRWMPQLWKTQLSYCGLLNLSPEQCLLTLPRRCRRRHRSTFRQLIQRACASQKAGCKASLPRRAGVWPQGTRVIGARARRALPRRRGRWKRSRRGRWKRSRRGRWKRSRRGRWRRARRGRRRRVRRRRRRRVRRGRRRRVRGGRSHYQRYREYLRRRRR